MPINKLIKMEFRSFTFYNYFSKFACMLHMIFAGEQTHKFKPRFAFKFKSLRWIKRFIFEAITLVVVELVMNVHFSACTCKIHRIGS